MQHLRTWIPVSDGTRLAARLWLPDERPAATVLEALPYRMDDLTSSYAGEYERQYHCDGQRTPRPHATNSRRTQRRMSDICH